MKNVFTTIMTATALIMNLVFVPHAHAEAELLTDTCAYEVNESESGTVQFFSLDHATCQNLKELIRGASIIGYSIGPVTSVLASSTVIAELGIASGPAAPAVLSVYVLGLAGVGVVHFVLDVTMEECEQMELRDLEQRVLDEVKAKYQLKSDGPVSGELRKE
jgi:hypothetical protein